MIPFAYRLLARFLNKFFHLLYHQMAWGYDFVAAAVSLGRWNTWVELAIPSLHGPRVLELGYGPGHLQVQLYAAGLAAIGLDTSSQMSRQAYRRLKQRGYIPALSQGIAKNLPFPSDCFHQVVSTFPSEYIFQSETLKEIYRVLQPGGQAIIIPLAWITGRGLLDRAAAWLFHITGEAPTWQDQWLDPLRTLGFAVEWQQVELPSSRVLLVQARKPENINYPG